MIEKAISYQITNYLSDNDLEESLQSAYKIFHSTETALVKAHNDIVSAINNQSYIILLLLDLSAAFDTLDHKFFCRDSLVVLVLMAKPRASLNRLQLVLNRAARIVTFTKKYEHITPSLMYRTYIGCLLNNVLFKQFYC